METTNVPTNPSAAGRSGFSPASPSASLLTPSFGAFRGSSAGSLAGLFLFAAVFSAALPVFSTPAAAKGIPPRQAFHAPAPAPKPHAIRTLSDKGAVALTFDDGPDAKGCTEATLDALDKEGVKATFFVVGRSVRQGASTLRRMKDEGHEIANHSWDHPDMPRLDALRQQEEIDRTRRELESFGIEARWFRPPYGDWNAVTEADAAFDGEDVVMWSAQMPDMKERGPKETAEILLRQIGPGGIVLLHSTQCWMPPAIHALVEGIRAKGLRPTTVADGMGAR